MKWVSDFVSLNGPDNVGKTTHLVRLAERWNGFQLLGAVHEYDSEPWARVVADDYARWWFETSTTAELTEMLLVGHAKRAAAREDGRTGLLDRGLRYLAVRSTQRLAEAGAVASVGTTGDFYDNAPAEAFHSLFKAELVGNRGRWKNLDEVETAVAEYVDWFNHRRLHGEIGLVPPAKFEDDFYQHESTSAEAEALVPSL